MATGNDIYAMVVDSGIVARCRGNGHGLAGSVPSARMGSHCARRNPSTSGARRAGAQVAPDVVVVRCTFNVERHPALSARIFVSLVPRAQQRLIPRTALAAERLYPHIL